MSEKNTDTHEWYTYAYGKPFRVQRFLDFSGSPCVRMKDGSFVPYSLGEIEHNIVAGTWLPVQRPADAIAPAYGLLESRVPVDTIDTTISYGDVFAWGRSEAEKRTYRLTIIKVKDDTVFYEDGTFVPISTTSLDHAMDLITSGFWRRVTEPAKSKDAPAAPDEHKPSDELTTLRRQYAESIAIIEALLQKYEPEMLVKIRGGDRVAVPHDDSDRVAVPHDNGSKLHEHSDRCNNTRGATKLTCSADCPFRLKWEAAGCPSGAST